MTVPVPKTVRDPKDLLLVFSNSALIPAIYMTYKRGEYIEMFILTMLTILSVMYHTCFSANVCFIDPTIWLFMDSLFASSLLTVLSVLYACFIHVIDMQLRVVFIMVAFLINGIFLAINDADVTVLQEVVILLYCGGIIVFSFMRLSFHYKDSRYLNRLMRKYKKKGKNTVLIVERNVYDCYRNTMKHLNKPFFFIGILLGLIGIALYMTTDYISRDNYWFVHSMWHVTAGIGVYLIIVSMSSEKILDFNK